MRGSSQRLQKSSLQGCLTPRALLALVEVPGAVEAHTPYPKDGKSPGRLFYSFLCLGAWRVDCRQVKVNLFYEIFFYS